MDLWSGFEVGVVAFLFFVFCVVFQWCCRFCLRFTWLYMVFDETGSDGVFSSSKGLLMGSRCGFKKGHVILEICGYGFELLNSGSRDGRGLFGFGVLVSIFQGMGFEV